MAYIYDAIYYCSLCVEISRVDMNMEKYSTRLSLTTVPVNLQTAHLNFHTSVHTEKQLHILIRSKNYTSNRKQSEFL